ncbi:Cytochrome c oxidase-assembly factor cox23 [Penicillium argentinense]|uniref:Cytochrome c oxidase-assembly factor cox23 n=1 Tax=Penicillium argentinense TaxID=1131581 RepID=A0A9W9G606_9EURO|nr:Cytochrome c oxidase-assembly factor cox23 [Penicillium argentinense]KAJ5112310.1 Cytochrome c oxidase-assembly factor cox23 [Penicillium argentinense]
MAAESTQDDAHGKTWQKAERKFSNKPASEFYDPCQDFADRSLKCLKRNNFDREMCGDYFQAYRDCKKNWLNQKKGVTKSG